MALATAVCAVSPALPALSSTSCLLRSATVAFSDAIAVAVSPVADLFLSALAMAAVSTAASSASVPSPNEAAAVLVAAVADASLSIIALTAATTSAGVAPAARPSKATSCCRSSMVGLSFSVLGSASDPEAAEATATSVVKFGLLVRPAWLMRRTVPSLSWSKTGEMKRYSRLATARPPLSVHSTVPQMPSSRSSTSTIQPAAGAGAPTRAPKARSIAWS